MNSIENYQNLVELLKQALKFYADEKNYFPAAGKLSSIELDEHGYQARFALNKIDELQNTYEKMEQDYLNNVVDDTEDNSFELLKKIEELKKYNIDEKSED